ncbi:guanine nucleotide exchange factor DBS isoform X1 [Seriola aureovittata]|uniref:guanine nucleotide exchange factor DBS isoform X1 n=2 Tax=Seriola aureovittata TaxID=2871759 RepID=UPI0024BD9C36|nr:guanine nucleotide exchange factor DBS isoform X1 [Seriola aureovittata]XP_056235367.1 guanine nucleotide exchange factor DBS isoform X1 [Seriola aureovittata]XP_056235368.1 guanine nucleotide exchange factor DBS isoform X1 [Seriola aureovittata]
MLCWLREDEMSVQELLQRVQCVITHVDEIMQQEIRPLLAVDIIEQLHRQFALLSGGRGKDGAPIITFPEYSSFSEVPDDDFLNVVTYLTSIPSLDAASIGFIIIIDRRKDKWSSVKASLSRIAGAFPGNLQLVLVLRPSRFFQRAIADIGIKLHKDDFKMKIVMLNSLSDLHGYVDKGQLTRELGGSLEYCHSQWIHHRTAIENFAMTVKTTAQMLQKFGTDLAETELPNDVQCTKDLLTAHTDKHNNLKDELKLALKQGTTLLGCIKEQAAKSENHKLNPDETENQTTVERLLAQLDETENAFEQFWCKHHLKLEQCLQLRHFEQDFREVKVSLDSLGDSLTTLSVIGDCLARVEQLLTELKTLEEKAQPTLEKAQLHALHGDQLIQSNHYAVDSIRPKCVELRRVCDDFSNEAKKKTDVLSKSLQIHTGIEKVNQWCESGIYLLASQAVDKCQSQEGAESALTDIERFLESAEKNQLTELRNLHNQYEVVLSEDIKASVLKALKRLEDVQEMFEKRHVSLKRLSAKQTRPVQPVAPRPESSPKRPSLKNPSRTTGSQQPLARRTSDNSNSGKQQAEADPNKRKNIRKAKGGIKIEVMHEESQGGSTHVVVTNETEESLSNRRRHIMTELIETERLYVEELQSIMEGYFAELDNSELSHLTPPSLENKRDVLFGNLPEIYEFHNRTFLRELENCTEKPELVGTCFLKRKEELQVYEKYCQNKPRSEVLWRQCGDSLFFQECQKKLDHKLSLDAYLLKPVQRITKYQLMLKEMLKCSKSEGVAELEEALATMLDIIKSVNDSMHQIAITGFEGNLSELGKLLMQGSFNVWTDHKKGHSKVKDLARFKPMQRHLFLYDKMLLFCKKREETTDGHEKTPSYSFKHSLKMSAVGITENVKGDSKKFEVWYNGREEVYIIQAPSMDVKNMWVSEIRKVLTGQLEACRDSTGPGTNIGTERITNLKEASQLNIYGAPMRNVRKLALRQSDSSSPESGFRRTNPSPNMRQKRVDVSANQSGHSVANARKRFTLQGLSNRRSLPAESAAKEAEVPRRFSLTSSLASSTSSSFATRRTKGPLSASIKSKRHEIKSDPTPFGYEDTLRGAMAAVGKRQSMISSTATAAGGTTVVPRSTSQPGWTQRRLPSMDTEDFETIPSSAEESSNSSEEEGNNKNGDSSRFRVQLTYDSRDSRDISLETGDLVQFLEEAENGHWLVKKLLTEETGLVPPRILQAASEGDIFTDLCTAALSDLDENEASTWESVSQDSR